LWASNSPSDMPRIVSSPQGVGGWLSGLCAKAKALILCATAGGQRVFSNSPLPIFRRDTTIYFRLPAGVPGAPWLRLHRRRNMFSHEQAPRGDTKVSKCLVEKLVEKCIRGRGTGGLQKESKKILIGAKFLACGAKHLHL